MDPKNEQQPETPAASTPAASPSPDTEENNIPFSWMLKPCEIYQLEYKDCKSIRDRFHQYFVHGELKECTGWKVDYENCTKWKDSGDTEALKSVINSEKSRVKTRLRSHYSNDIWTNRTSPPSDWNKPLPPEISKQYEGTFLSIKANEVNEGKINIKDPTYVFAGTRCNIL